MTQKLLRTREAAEILQVSPATLRYWRMVGTGPDYFRVGSSVRYDAGDLQRYLETNRVSSSVQALLEEKNGVA